MLARIAQTAVRHPRRVIVITVIFIAFAATFGISAAKHLSSGGFSDPSSQSARAKALLASQFDAGDTNFVLIVSSPGGADSDSSRAAGEAAVQQLRQAQFVSQVQSYWTAPAPIANALLSKDGRTALVVAQVAGNDTRAPERGGALAKQLVGVHDGATIEAGGSTVASYQVTNQIAHDLAIAEAIAIPLTVLVLIWLFGSALAALLPAVLGLISIASTMAILRLVATFTPVSVYALNMTTTLGFALAIDYSLFVVSRYREELRRGVEPTEAILRTVVTAGRTVVFSALTVGLSLAALGIFPMYFLRSFAYAGVAVVATTAISAIVILPAALALLGRRVDAYDVRRPVLRLFGRPDPKPISTESPFWAKVATVVMRRAIPLGVLGIAALVVLGSPFLSVKFGSPDDRVLPASMSSRAVGDTLRADYASNAADAMTLVIPDDSADPGAITTYAATLRQVRGVESVTPGPVHGDATYLIVANHVEPFSSAGSQLVHDLRAVPSPWPVQLTGQAAENVDALASLGADLPLALLLIAIATFIVLFLFTGSLVLPIKALVLNTLSLTATFGTMVWVFQDGHLHWLFHSTSTGYLSASMPILMFCLAFGMSMDYEIFLLSRIREEWLATGDNTLAVSRGLARTGRIVTAAAVLMAIVFIGVATSTVSFIQLFGSGMALAVLMDATLVRGVLVPAFMRVAGRWNWWAPAPLARLHRRYGWSDERPLAAAVRIDAELVQTG